MRVASTLLAGSACCGLFIAACAIAWGAYETRENREALDRSTAALKQSIETRSDVTHALAFSCGVLAGQRLMIKAGNIPIQMPQSPVSCGPIQSLAEKAGFKP